jgi:DNA-binding response OmpR family regulator
MENITNNKKILVVEDDPPILRALVDKLTREGFTVFQGINGEEGLAVALAERPDIILLDILMPVMDGSTMMTSLRGENEWGKKVPIILLTNLSTAEIKVMKAVIEADPAYYLVKSNWSMTDVLIKIKETLNI